jgi:hypothetical protein
LARIAWNSDIFAPQREDFLAGGGLTWLREKS